METNHHLDTALHHLHAARDDLTESSGDWVTSPEYSATVMLLAQATDYIVAIRAITAQHAEAAAR